MDKINVIAVFYILEYARFLGEFKSIPADMRNFKVRGNNLGNGKGNVYYENDLRKYPGILKRLKKENLLTRDGHTKRGKKTQKV